MSVAQIALWNLPFGITEERLRQELTSLWPEGRDAFYIRITQLIQRSWHSYNYFGTLFTVFLKDGMPNNNVVIKVYKPQAKKQVAVVSGFFADSRSIKQSLTGKYIDGRMIKYASVCKFTHNF